MFIQIARTVCSSLVGYEWFNRGMLVFGWVLSEQWFGSVRFGLVWFGCLAFGFRVVG